eukprot:TRINITY_DN4675_c0_g1_i1.p1 TRINITY_DN4675_c0_g1~~TRINITY_DN4675_c0_g1_i1.p1  ORF type:complete len:163 (-),score=28.45 TRINITY_DN4675_c0_g1_i1:152-640(-)
MGNTIKTALAIIERPNFTWFRGALDIWKHNQNNASNGSLMRNAAIPAIFSSKELTMEAIDATVLCSLLTHFGPLSVLCCVLHTLLIREAFFADFNSPPDLEFMKKTFYLHWSNWKSNTKHCRFWIEIVGEKSIQVAEEQMFDELKGFETEYFYGMEDQGTAY